MAYQKLSCRTKICALQVTFGNTSRPYGKQGYGCRPPFTRKRIGMQRSLSLIVERYLRTLAAGNERHWGRLLTLAEFSYNAHTHKATSFRSRQT